jgi:DNA polymerase V
VRPSPRPVVELRPSPNVSVRVVAPYVAGPVERRPLFSARVPAGFPSPADDHVDRALDLHELCVRNPAATYFVRVEGHSMVEAGIHDGDVLVVDRSVPPADGRVVVAVLNGELTVKRLRVRGREVWLAPENALFAPVTVTPEMDFEVWGVVTHVVHALTKL